MLPQRAERNLGRDEFWKMAVTEQMITEYRVNKDLCYLQTASPEALRQIFVQYRFFTLYYITDLAILVSRLSSGGLRSLLAQVLSDELGIGEPSRAHPELYDSFLRSIGIDESELEKPIIKNIKLLNKMQNLVIHDSVSTAIGVRGMGGECLCQIYLSVMFEHFSKNPYIKSIWSQIDWRFWDIHTGEEDIHHREMTRASVDQYLISNPDSIQDLADGYQLSKGAWDSFWANIFENVKELSLCTNQI